MKRKVYNLLLDWKQNRSRREALLIDGARRIGKSWVVEDFAKREYKSYIIINFSKISEELLNVFEHYLMKPDELFARLQLWSGVKLWKHKSLIIFDEVQCYPKAREAIKWLVADGRYDYIETGSLVSIRKNTSGIVLPSEECHIDMWPMDFEEFLWALGEDVMMNYIRDCYVGRRPLGQAIHRKALDLVRLYMIVGGMPQAVEAYVRTRDFAQVDHIKRNILSLYRSDIYQYAPDCSAKVAQVWDFIPSQLQRHEKRFRIGDMQRGARSRSYADAFFWLDEARVVNPCYAATEPSVGLKLNRDDSKYKLYLGDTGLLISHAFDEEAIAQEELYRKLMLGKLEINCGMLVENLVAQMLRAGGHPLYYFSKTDRSNAAENMEIDFLLRKSTITNKHNVYAVEVKSTQRYTTSSLDKFQHKFSANLHTPVIVHTADLKVQDGVLFLPIYMTPLL